MAVAGAGSEVVAVAGEVVGSVWDYDGSVGLVALGSD